MNTLSIMKASSPEREPWPRELQSLKDTQRAWDNYATSRKLVAYSRADVLALEALREDLPARRVFDRIVSQLPLVAHTPTPRSTSKNPLLAAPYGAPEAVIESHGILRAGNWSQA